MTALCRLLGALLITLLCGAALAADAEVLAIVCGGSTATVDSLSRFQG